MVAPTRSSKQNSSGASASTQSKRQRDDEVVTAEVDEHTSKRRCEDLSQVVPVSTPELLVQARSAQQGSPAVCTQAGKFHFQLTLVFDIEF
jgi:hypothetical protein